MRPAEFKQGAQYGTTPFFVWYPYLHGCLIGARAHVLPKNSEPSARLRESRPLSGLTQHGPPNGKSIEGFRWSRNEAC